MVRVAAAALVVSLLTGAGGAQAAAASDTPTFSTARDDVSVMLWLRRNTSLRGGQSVMFADDSVLVVLSDTVDAARPAVHRVGFRQEATGIGFVSRTGGRSIRGAADVDCTTGRVKAQSIGLYSGSDLRGDQVLSQGPDLDFRAPVYGTASALVLSEVCQQRHPNTQVASAPPPLAPRPPVQTTQLQAPQAQIAQAQIAPIGPPSPRPPPIAQAPLPPPEPPRPPEPPPPVAPAPGVMAQIGAFSSREAAEAAWSKLSAAFPAELTGKTVRIEPAVVGGQQVFRTSVDGFASETAARTACAELMARSQACFVRRPAP